MVKPAFPMRVRNLIYGFAEQAAEEQDLRDKQMGMRSGKSKGKG